MFDSSGSQAEDRLLEVMVINYYYMFIVKVPSGHRHHLSCSTARIFNMSNYMFDS